MFRPLCLLLITAPSCGLIAGCSETAASSNAPAPDAAHRSEQPLADARSPAAPAATDAAIDASTVYHVPLRVHVGRSGLDPQTLLAVLTEINQIWFEQARICFEMSVVTSEATSERQLELFFTQHSVPGAPGVNGIYRGHDDIWSVDRPHLSRAPNPVTYPAARTAAHELGHALGLRHQNCGDACPCEAPAAVDCDDLLLRSGYLGFGLTEFEVARARRFAATWPQNTALDSCSAPHGLESL